MAGFEQHGSACSGGRYDALATDGRITYPGVGISFGVTRVLGLLFGRGLTASRSVPTVVLVAVTDEERRADAEAVADALRARGVSALVSPARRSSASRSGSPTAAASRSSGSSARGEGGADQVKDIRSGDQVDADATSWAPPADLRPGVPAGLTTGQPAASWRSAFARSRRALRRQTDRHRVVGGGEARVGDVHVAEAAVHLQRAVVVPAGDLLTVLLGQVHGDLAVGGLARLERGPEAPVEVVHLRLDA